MLRMATWLLILGREPANEVRAIASAPSESGSFREASEKAWRPLCDTVPFVLWDPSAPRLESRNDVLRNRERRGLWSFYFGSF